MNHGMSAFFALIRKELRHIWRDKRSLAMLLAMPVAQILIFGYAITNEIRNTPVAVLDASHDEVSRLVTDRFTSSRYFDVVATVNSPEELDNLFRQGRIRLALSFPVHFGQDLMQTGSAGIQLISDASDPNEATTVTFYASNILVDMQREGVTGSAPGGASGNVSASTIVPYVEMLYNPQLISAYNFVPGIMGMILMLICALMTSISIVREKEQGTMEILLVSPIRPVAVVVAKAIPYMLVAMTNVVTILLLSVFLLGVPVAGSLWLVLGLSFVFTLSALSLGLLISSITHTQMAAMLISVIALMLPVLMLSGLIFPVENMPLPLRIVSNIVPAKWYIFSLKDVMIKGLGFGSVLGETGILVGMSLFLVLLSVSRFKTRL